MSLLQNSLSEVHFPSPGVCTGRVRPGRAGTRDTDDLIDGERDDAEHEMAFDLDCAADAEGSGAEFVFQSGVDAFGHGAKIVDQVVGVGHVDEFHALDFSAPFGLGFVLGAKVAVDDRSMAERLALVMDGGGVVGGIHEIVEIGDAGAGHGHQGNGDLTVVDGGRGQHAGDRDLAAGHVEVEFVPGPGLLVALAVFLAADSQAVGRSASIWPRFCVACRSRRVGSGLGRCSSLRGRPRLRGGEGLSGGGGSPFPSLAVF